MKSPVKNQMNCEQFCNQLLEVGGLAEIAPIHQAHVQGCTSCGEEMARLLEVRSIFSSVALTEPSYSSLQFVIQKSRDLAQKPGLWANLVSWVDSRVPSLSTSFNWAPALMVLMLTVSGVFFAQNKFEPSSFSDSIQPQVASLKSPAGVRPSYSLFPSGTGQMISPVEKVALTTGGLAGDNLGAEAFSAPSANEDDLKKALLEEDADNLLMRGRRFKSMGRVDLALKDFETIFHYYPGYTYIGDVLMYRSQCYAFQGNFEKAVESLEIYKKKDPSKSSLLDPMINQLRLEQAKNQ